VRAAAGAAFATPRTRTLCTLSTMAPEVDFFGGAYYVAARLRTRFAFGSKRPGRRHAFTLAFDSRVDF